MAGLRLVPGERAGPAALGILVPPGTRTVLIVRPRSLKWDLLLVQGVSGTVFREMNREEAATTARGFHDALVDWNRGGVGLIESVACADGYRIWIDVGDYCFVVCERRPGQPYRALLLGSEGEARHIAAQIGAVLHPVPNGEQEVYFNTNHFVR